MVRHAFLSAFSYYLNAYLAIKRLYLWAQVSASASSIILAEEISSHMNYTLYFCLQLTSSEINKNIIKNVMFPLQKNPLVEYHRRLSWPIGSK